MIFLESLAMGQLPRNWLDAVIAPICFAENYRPVSLLCIICKVLECIITPQIVDYIKAHVGLITEWYLLTGIRSLKDLFHMGDRAVIYIFIAASYTPWLLLKDMESWGLQVRWLIWLLAVLGISYQYMFHERYKWLETILYLVISVCPSVTILAMKESSGLYELTLGGLTYATGVVFFKCDGIIPFAHAIWHCFVLVGATFHFYAVSTYLMGHSIHKQSSLVVE